MRLNLRCFEAHHHHHAFDSASRAMQSDGSTFVSQSSEQVCTTNVTGRAILQRKMCASQSLSTDFSNVKELYTTWAILHEIVTTEGQNRIYITGIGITASPHYSRLITRSVDEFLSSDASLHPLSTEAREAKQQNYSNSTYGHVINIRLRTNIDTVRNPACARRR